MRSLALLFVLLALLWLLTCTHAGDDAARSSARELLAAASERALVSLAPDLEPARSVPVSLPADVGPALRALHGTGQGGRVVALEAAIERAARLALADGRPRIEEAVAGFVPADPEALLAGPDDAVSVAFRTASEANLRAALTPVAENRLAETGAHAALQEVRNGASRLPLPRDVDLDLVSIVTDHAMAGFFAALAAEERRLRQERIALRALSLDHSRVHGRGGLT